jgi:GTP-binding protein
VLVVDLSAPDPSADLAVLRAELAAYDETLAARPAVIAATKADLVEDAAAGAAALGGDVAVVSAMTGEGVDELLARLGLLAKEAAVAEEAYQPTVVLRPGRARFTIERRADGGWEVAGRSVERWIMETDLDDEREVTILQSRLKKEGVDRKLAALGAKAGDDVHIKGRIFEYVPDEPPVASSTPPTEPADA